MTEDQSFHRYHREHVVAPGHLDDDQLARLAEEERVDPGLDAYDPDEVPPAPDTPPLPEDITQSEVYQEERAEIRREVDKGELWTIDEQHPFPPSSYDNS